MMKPAANPDRPSPRHWRSESVKECGGSFGYDEDGTGGRQGHDRSEWERRVQISSRCEVEIYQG